MTTSRARPNSIWVIMAVLLAGIVSLSSSLAARLNLSEPIETVEAESYNVYLTLRAPAKPANDDSATLIFARDGDRYYSLVFSARATTLLRCAEAKQQRLAEGLPAVRAGQDVELVVKRRPVRISVEADGEVLLEAWDSTYHEGEVCLGPAASGLELSDVLVEPAVAVLFSDDFLAEQNRGALWEPIGGTWAIETYRDRLIARDRGPVQASWYAAQGENAVSLTGDEFWEDCRLEVSALARADTWMGLVLSATPHGFTRFAVLPGAEQAKAGLFDVRNGQSRPLVEAPVSCPPEQWHRLAVEATPTDLRAFLNGELVLSAPTPGAGSGRAGLFVSGAGKVPFDDFAARGLDSFADHFAGRLDARWELPRGRWELARGKLVGAAASDALALVAHRTWGDAAMSVKLDKAADASAGPVWRYQNEENYCALLATGDAWRLVRRVDGTETSLAEGRLPEGEALDLTVTCRGPQIVLQANGSELARVYDFALHEGRVGILARGRGRAVADDFEVRSVTPDPAETLFITRCEDERLPGPGHGMYLPAIGYLWRPATQGWTLVTLPEGNHVLRGAASPGAPGLVAYRQDVPGSVMLSVALPSEPEGEAGLAICTDGTNAATGYAVLIARTPSLSMKLLRRGQVVAKRDQLTQEEIAWPATLALFRDGPLVGASLGSLSLTYTDPEPLPDGRPALWVSREAASFDDIRLANLHATVDRFDRPAPEWAPSHGRWLVHSGMACIPWDYWTTGFGEPLAVTWRREPQPADFVLDFNVSEYSEGEEDGEHRHFPYHDVSIAFCGDGRDPNSGYRFIIGADRGRATKLLRRGQVVAMNEDRRFHVYMGPHCNYPRAFDVRVEKRGAYLCLTANGAVALQYTDPQPLGPGRIGIGVANCAADFRDVVLYTWPVAKDSGS